MITGVTHVDALIAKIAHTGQAIGRKWKIPPSVIIAQATLETGWGQAVKGNAYFGIKQGASAGEGLAFSTHEVIDGQVVTRVDRFRTYRSLQDAANAYGQLLHETPRYKEAKKTSDPAQFAEELQQAGYATDSRYAEKLKQLIQRYQLTAYDHAQQTTPLHDAPVWSSRNWGQSGSGSGMSAQVPADPKQLTPCQPYRNLRPLSLGAKRTEARYQTTVAPVCAATERQPRPVSGPRLAPDKQRLTVDRPMQAVSPYRDKPFAASPRLLWEQIRQFRCSRGWYRPQPSKLPLDA